MAELNAVLESDLPAFNAMVAGKDLPAVVIGDSQK